MDFTITFGYRKNKPIYKDFDLTVQDGKITVICGHNGVGKTTLLKVMAGILPSNLKEQTGWFVGGGETGGLIRHFSLNDHIKMIGNAPTDFYSEAFALFHASEFCNKPVKTLSAGQTAIASVLTAFASNEPFLLLDEPFAALDPVNAQNLVTLLQKRNGTTLITSHDLFLTAEIADTVVFLKEGKITWQNSEKPFAHGALQAKYREFA